MSKKDYVKMAVLIGGVMDKGERERLAEGFSDMLKKDNSQFNREKFLTACNVQKAKAH